MLAEDAGLRAEPRAQRHAALGSGWRSHGGTALHSAAPQGIAAQRNQVGWDERSGRQQSRGRGRGGEQQQCGANERAGLGSVWFLGCPGIKLATSPKMAQGRTANAGREDCTARQWMGDKGFQGKVEGEGTEGGPGVLRGTRWGHPGPGHPAGGGARRWIESSRAESSTNARAPADSNERGERATEGGKAGHTFPVRRGREWRRHVLACRRRVAKALSRKGKEEGPVVGRGQLAGRAHYEAARRQARTVARADLTACDRQAPAQAFWSANFTTRRLLGPTWRPLKALMAAAACIVGCGGVAESRWAGVSACLFGWTGSREGKGRGKLARDS